MYLICCVKDCQLQRAVKSNRGLHLIECSLIFVFMIVFIIVESSLIPFVTLLVRFVFINHFNQVCVYVLTVKSK